MINSKPYLCRHCKNPLGITSDKTLSVGLVKINKTVTLQCGHCGREMTWNPVTVKNSAGVQALSRNAMSETVL